MVNCKYRVCCRTFISYLLTTDRLVTVKESSLKHKYFLHPTLGEEIS